MRVHLLAIGQADAIVLELPSGRLAGVDFGHPALLDYLDALDPARARRYAFCLLTHAHHDHYACLEEFLRRHDDRVEQYWFSFTDPGVLPPLLALKAAVLRGPRPRGQLVVQDLPAAQPMTIEPGVEVVRFGPTTAEALRPAGAAGAENARSVVLLVRHGRAAALLGADTEGERWRRIAAQARATGLELAADLVKAPHHGAGSGAGLPDDLWPVVARTLATPIIFTVGRQRDKPALATIRAARTHGAVRCTGRALTCRPLPDTAGLPAFALGDDLIARALRPAPEAEAVPACFGTQVYDLDPAGGVAVVRSERPAFLDACVVP